MVYRMMMDWSTSDHHRNDRQIRLPNVDDRMATGSHSILETERKLRLFAILSSVFELQE